MSEIDAIADKVSELEQVVKLELCGAMFSDSMLVEAAALLKVVEAKLRTAALFQAREIAGNL